MYVGIDAAYILCGRIAGVAIVISSAEELSLLRNFRQGGVYNQRVMAVGVRTGANPMARTLAIRTAPLAISLAARLAAGFVLLLGPDAPVFMRAAWTTAAVMTFFLRWRHRYGGEDGADQMLSILTTTLAACLLLSSVEGVKAAGLYFVGAQACLAYVTAGSAKLVSPQWRSGLAIRGILSTRTYGLRPLASQVQKSPCLALAMCWGVIAFESTFIFAPILPPVALLALLGVAALFHACVALTMGLNGFFWSFLAAYPAIVYLNQALTS